MKVILKVISRKETEHNSFIVLADDSGYPHNLCTTEITIRLPKVDLTNNNSTDVQDWWDRWKVGTKFELTEVNALLHCEGCDEYGGGPNKECRGVGAQ